MASRIYGNPKVHKSDIPSRPIVSDIQGPTSKLDRSIPNNIAAVIKAKGGPRKIKPNYYELVKICNQSILFYLFS